MVPNIYWGLNFEHELDIAKVSRKSKYLQEIEIKISKADLQADKKKNKWKTGIMFGDKRISQMYFAVPKEMEDYALENIPDECGLYIIEEDNATKIKASQRNPKATKLTDEEYLKICELGCMRIQPMTKKIVKLMEEQ